MKRIITILALLSIFAISCKENRPHESVLYAIQKHEKSIDSLEEELVKHQKTLEIIALYLQKTETKQLDVFLKEYKE